MKLTEEQKELVLKLMRCQVPLYIRDYANELDKENFEAYVKDIEKN